MRQRDPDHPKGEESPRRKEKKTDPGRPQFWTAQGACVRGTTRNPPRAPGCSCAGTEAARENHARYRVPQGDHRSPPRRFRRIDDSRTRRREDAGPDRPQNRGIGKAIPPQRKRGGRGTYCRKPPAVRAECAQDRQRGWRNLGDQPKDKVSKPGEDHDTASAPPP